MYYMEESSYQLNHIWCIRYVCMSVYKCHFNLLMHTVTQLKLSISSGGNDTHFKLSINFLKIKNFSVAT